MVRETTSGGHLRVQTEGAQEVGRAQVLKQVREVLVEAVVAGGGAEVAGEVLVAHVHVEVLRVVEVGGAESTQLWRRRDMKEASRREFEQLGQGRRALRDQHTTVRNRANVHSNIRYINKIFFARE
jgi:hypothetical protein